MRDPDVDDLHAAPGNPGIGAVAELHQVDPVNLAAVAELAAKLSPDLVVVGPEAPLVAGLADHLRHAGVAVFGPGASAARIEGSKTFAKEVMAAAGVPTAASLSVARAPCVVKVDGLAAGKGVFVCRTQEELDAGLREVGGRGDSLLIEELLEGEELSLFAVCDGRQALPLAPAQDFKRIGDGDTGPNTGGMGTFSPVPGFGSEEVADLVERIHAPVAEQLARRGAPFAGVLFAGLMLTSDGPRVLEFNCRFGDPETQPILMRLESDLVSAMEAAIEGRISDGDFKWSPQPAVCVVVASGGYPGTFAAGRKIVGLEQAAQQAGVRVFHAGTSYQDGTYYTTGGRVLGVTARAETLGEAVERAYAAVSGIGFEGMHYRKDIAARVVKAD